MSYKELWVGEKDNREKAQKIIEAILIRSLQSLIKNDKYVVAILSVNTENSDEGEITYYFELKDGFCQSDIEYWRGEEEPEEVLKRIEKRIDYIAELRGKCPEYVK